MIEEDKLVHIVRSLKAYTGNQLEKYQQSIKMTQDLEGILPGVIDPATDSAVSEARRQEIYDHCVPMAEELLGIKK